MYISQNLFYTLILIRFISCIANDANEMSAYYNESSKILGDQNIFNDLTKRSANDITLNQLKTLLEKKLRSNKRTIRENKAENSTSTTSTASTKPAAVWQEWTAWSSCSVTCGKGRHIRWRHCKENCSEAETEMEEKSCQLPACPQKLFGLIKL
ncbi:unnamed protein product [Phyllotreta striolata]|uniref:Uncharacterized protein n=1 Tax=Phyllotreta striolata TaxID=444603 RepID=A0A9N9XNR4_PHYSR|nr:unnamed protein product [Phyllotreta striolata]